MKQDGSCEHRVVEDAVRLIQTAAENDVCGREMAKVMTALVESIQYSGVDPRYAKECRARAEAIVTRHVARRMFGEVAQ